MSRPTTLSSASIATRVSRDEKASGSNRPRVKPISPPRLVASHSAETLAASVRCTDDHGTTRSPARRAEDTLWRTLAIRLPARVNSPRSTMASSAIATVCRPRAA
ncbi:MAG: hypothetical protein R2726_17960 [Acidimicrobiales bacterium]